jgi:hypothetical protein
MILNVYENRAFYVSSIRIIKAIAKGFSLSVNNGKKHYFIVRAK